MWRAELPYAVDPLVLHQRDPARYPFLLQSVAGHPQSGRWDLLFACPEAALELTPSGLTGPASATADFFQALDAWSAEEGLAAPVPDLPFAGGWFLFLAYEAARQIETRLRLPAAASALPQALAVRCPAAVLIDRERGCSHVLSERSAAQMEVLREDVCRAVGIAPDYPPPGLESLAEDPPERYLDGVRRVLDYLQAGDVFQVNLSRAWHARLPPAADAVALYAQLRRSNPAPFAGLLRWRDAAVLSSSPERLIQLDGGWAQTRPIAGTRPRSADADEDARLRAGLQRSLKERAEHVMLIDLERNDLGRICLPGSVEVSELMRLESYAHVHHIVSNVRGRLRPGTGPGAALRAVFPGGTITGCPKVRTMEIIAELEGEGRGAYTGSMGYLSRDGRMDSNILIRTLEWQPGQVTLRAGAGIVADSQAEAELAETQAKARGLLLALGAGA